MKAILLTAMMLAALATSAQEKSNGIELMYGFGKTAVYQKGDLTDATGFTGRHFDSFGIAYTNRFNQLFSIYTGLSYLKSDIRALPPASATYESSEINLFYIPIGVKMTVFKYVFIKGNAVIAIDASEKSSLSNQSGLGGGMSAGVQYTFKNRAGIYVASYFNQHGIMLFNRSANSERLMESGFQIGFSYHF